MTYERNETPAHRLDRNWVELLQELRVTQTGVQVLAGFLLTIPFSERFGDLGRVYRHLYLVSFGLAVLSTGLLITPVAIHRKLFAHRRKDILVRVADILARAGLATLGLTLVAVVTLIFGVVGGAVTGWIAGGVAALFFVLAWVVLPARLLHEPRD